MERRSVEGEFKVKYNSIYSCGSSEKNLLQWNVFFSKRTPIITDLKGNLTYLVPFDNSIMGEFKMKYNSIYSCGSSEKNLLQWNVFFSKRTPTITDLKGNLTYLVPFDNSIMFTINFAVKGTNNAWISNAHIVPFKKACDTTKMINGKNAWEEFLTAFNIPKPGCPISPGVYVSSGFDLNFITDIEYFPKVFFYGIYKVNMTFTNTKEKFLGCFIIVVDVVRPWEI
ncbi:uncharacterized protein LOC126898574 isoform X1 [Daktulosphaira vitifoliae]|uniref:uncharacterized protein LOC126898574 isoform X1 n=1 Tax=Daktulosphaira vitifoliae TaxID=58002 RepID=UPI0021AAF835|nr:uncharacterized protein LOC126898574 isoform X1 [Daktulosphaira vitifoliae]XP_050528734.1 uncharacterized protein LOC126898574 isoform X1 [Daktulosphaira vitifoliae]XP_050528735.1 uncharacterized protein LOC126898574 isoform X1 [Daktulosphaira vitifoliae]